MIKIYNPTTKHTTYVDSMYEMPQGYVIDSRHPDSTQRKHISKAAKERGTPECAYRNKSGENNPMYGKKQSDETKKKISETMKNKKLKNALKKSQ